MTLEARHHKVVKAGRVLIPHFVTGLEDSRFRGQEAHLVQVPSALRFRDSEKRLQAIPAYRSTSEPGPKTVRLEVAARRFPVAVAPGEPGFFIPSNETVNEIAGTPTLSANGVDIEDAEVALLRKIVNEMGKERPPGSDKSARVVLFDESRVVAEAATWYIDPQAISYFRRGSMEQTTEQAA